MSALARAAQIGTLAHWPRQLLITAIRVYHLVLSPQLAPTCRFEPSCSAYAIGSDQRHGDPALARRRALGAVIPGAASVTTRCPEGRRGPQSTARVRSFVRGALRLDDGPAAAAPETGSGAAGRGSGTAATGRSGARCPAAGGTPAAEPADAGAPALPAQSIPIARPLYLAELSNEGASLRDWELTRYHDRHGDPIRLVSRGDPLATAVTPFTELSVGDLSKQTGASRADPTPKCVSRGRTAASRFARRSPSPTTVTISGYA